MDIVTYIFTGALVGFAVGLTGVGGGSLMTPLLLLFGFPPHIAIGTDLLYAAITKSSGVWVHKRQHTIQWPIVKRLAMGSIPASLLTILILRTFFPDSESYSSVLTGMLGVMLILTSLVLFFRKRILQHSHAHHNQGFLHHAQQKAPQYTLMMGIVLGMMVTLSSVGAGAFGAAVLLVLYPKLPSLQVIGTDLAHAVPLTLVAGLGHVYLGNVNYLLLGALLVGSLPAIYVGTRLASRLPEHILQPILVSMLMSLGVKYAFF